MENQRPPEIKATHLAKDAAVYQRQSTARQVEENTGSGEYQRAQAEWALKYGWREDQIVVFDQDQGRSGSTLVNRPDYLRLIQRIQRRERRTSLSCIATWRKFGHAVFGQTASPTRRLRWC